MQRGKQFQGKEKIYACKHHDDEHTSYVEQERKIDDET